MSGDNYDKADKVCNDKVMSYNDRLKKMELKFKSYLGLSSKAEPGVKRHWHKNEKSTRKWDILLNNIIIILENNY